MRKKIETNQDSEKKRFRVLSNELEDLIKTNRDESTHLFAFATRRGLSSITVCDDCENIVMCRQCKTPVVLHTSEDSGRNFFMCHVCGDRRSAEETCQSCGSWRLTPLGIGVDRVYEEIKTSFPDVDIFRIDADSTKTDKQIKETLEKFKAKPGSILVGTEMAMQYLGDKIDHIAVVSLDSLFSLPDFRIQEKIMYLLVRLRAQSSRSILVQTRRAEQKVFEYGLKGNLSDFYRDNLEERKQFSYPPFSTLVKITIEGKKDEIANEMGEIAKFLEPIEIDVFPAFTSTVRGKSVIHGLIKIPSNSWPDSDLISKIRTLPPNITIKINPESLL
jgi:primosomal protein N' (replication factor Y)